MLQTEVKLKGGPKQLRGKKVPLKPWQREGNILEFGFHEAGLLIDGPSYRIKKNWRGRLVAHHIKEFPSEKYYRKLFLI